MEYEHALDYADETNNLARAANKAAEDANTLARRALLTARISAATTVIALIATNDDKSQCNLSFTSALLLNPSRRAHAVMNLAE